MTNLATKHANPRVKLLLLLLLLLLTIVAAAVVIVCSQLSIGGHEVVLVASRRMIHLELVNLLNTTGFSARSQKCAQLIKTI